MLTLHETLEEKGIDPATWNEHDTIRDINAVLYDCRLPLQLLPYEGLLLAVYNSTYLGKSIVLTYTAYTDTPTLFALATHLTNLLEQGELIDEHLALKTQ